MHVDQEQDFLVTFLAPNFEAFVRGLVPESDYDTSEDELEAALTKIQERAFSLTQLLARSSSPNDIEGLLRRLLHATATEKGYFGLHADPLSHLVYDVLFDLFTASHAVHKSETFLDAYPDLIAFGDGEVSTDGYAPEFLVEWITARLAAGEIAERDGQLTLSDAHRQTVKAQLARFSE